MVWSEVIGDNGFDGFHPFLQRHVVEAVDVDGAEVQWAVSVHEVEVTFPPDEFHLEVGDGRVDFLESEHDVA